MKKTFLAVLFAMALPMTASAATTTIDFDSLGQGTVVGSSFAGVTFTDAVVTNNFGLTGSSGGNGIFHSLSGFQPTQAQPISAVFSQLVSSVSLRGIDVGSHGFILKAFNAANTLVDSAQVFGSDIGVGEFFDLIVSGSNIVSVQFSQVENLGSGDGMLFDNFSFTHDVAAVPLPATLPLLAVGLIGLGAVRRRRRA